MLKLDPDEWTPAAPGRRASADLRPLSARHILTVRALERSLPPSTERGEEGGTLCERFTDNWAAFWEQCAGCRQAADDSGSACVEWLTEPRECYLDLIDDGCCALALERAPSNDDLSTMLDEDIAIILWSAQPMAAEAKKRLQHELAKDRPKAKKRGCLSDLPHALYFVRRSSWVRSAKDPDRRHTGHLHLLWDDPHRVPKRLGRKDAAGLQPRLENPMQQT